MTASLLYSGSVGSTSGIITAVGTATAVKLFVVPGANNQQVYIYHEA